MAMMKDIQGALLAARRAGGGGRVPAIAPPTAGPAIPVQRPAMPGVAVPSPEPVQPPAATAAPATPVVPPPSIAAPSGPMIGATAAPGALAGGGATVPYAQTSTFGPGADLRTTQIAPNEQANRYKIAGERFDQFAQATEPEYMKAIRKATQAAAAHGRLGSGMLTTDYGNLADRRASEMDRTRRSFMTDALEGSIMDDYRSRGELRGEREYQQGMARTGIGDRITEAELRDRLQNSELQRRLSAGEAASRLGYTESPYAYALQAAAQARNAQAGGGDWLGQLGQSMGYGMQPVAGQAAPAAAPGGAMRYTPGASGYQPITGWQQPQQNPFLRYLSPGVN
jgi:hypothetical protein